MKTTNFIFGAFFFLFKLRLTCKKDVEGNDDSVVIVVVIVVEVEQDEKEEGGELYLKEWGRCLLLFAPGRSGRQAGVGRTRQGIL